MKGEERSVELEEPKGSTLDTVSYKKVAETESRMRVIPGIESVPLNTIREKTSKLTPEAEPEQTVHVPPDAVPENNLWLLIPSLMMTMFLVAINGTLLATALPTICGDLNATAAQYTWMGTSYLVGLTVVAPFVGRLSDIYGRKPILHVMMFLHLLASGLGGGAKNMPWLITARALQGVAGGGIQSLLSIIVADIIPLPMRGLYQGYMSAVWTAAAVAGPVMGGAFATSGAWRWCFWINFPTCGLGWVAFTLTLHLRPRELKSAKEIFREFDFAGVFLLSVGSGIFNVGLAQAASDGISSRYSWPYIVAGGILLVAGLINCRITRRRAVIPRRVFQARTPLILLVTTFLSSMAFIPTLYLLPILFQGVRRASAVTSGLYSVPYEAALCLSGVVSGQLVSRMQWTRSLVWIGFAAGTIGYGLFYAVFRYPFGLGAQIVVSLFTGWALGISGAGVLLQASMPVSELAGTLAAAQFLRMIGGGIGFSATEAIFNTVCRNKFAKIPGYGTQFVVPQSTADYDQIGALPDALRGQVLVAFSNGLGYTWLWSMVCQGLAFALSLGLRTYSLNRTGEAPERKTASKKSAQESAPTEEEAGRS